MDFKKLFINNKAVSPVIGVILMVAITVILAAAIGSAVFGQGTAESAPQANLDIQPDDTYVAAVTGESIGSLASVKVEHLGGDPINFAETSTKVTILVNDSASDTILPSTVSTNLGVLSVGDVKTLKLKGTTNGGPATTITPGSTVNIKFIDKKTNQLICDRTVRF